MSHSLHSPSSEKAIELETKYGAHNYAPLPFVISRGSGARVWDPEGNQYLDFLSGIAAVSQGHCHPRLVAALTQQAGRLTLPSRAFYSDAFGPFAEYATRYFGFDRLLMMNTGVEAVETALKLCRKWGYREKKIPEGQAKILVCENNFHGRTLAAISASSGKEAATLFGPLLPGFQLIPFGDLAALEQALAKDPHIAGFLVEPIQGEGGVVVPSEGYLRQAAALCRSANVLFIADEIQTGIGRTGKRLACDHEGVKPDILVLGKALSGGLFPISAILADDPVMLVWQPGDHGSTFGGNPLACVVATTALQIVQEEALAEKADALGKRFREQLQDLPPPVIAVRGRGLLNALVLDPGYPVAKDLCLRFKAKGLIAKNTRDHLIRFAPPLVISEAEILAATEIIREAVNEVAAFLTGEKSLRSL